LCDCLLAREGSRLVDDVRGVVLDDKSIGGESTGLTANRE